MISQQYKFFGAYSVLVIYIFFVISRLMLYFVLALDLYTELFVFLVPLGAAERAGTAADGEALGVAPGVLVESAPAVGFVAHDGAHLEGVAHVVVVAVAPVRELVGEVVLGLDALDALLRVGVLGAVVIDAGLQGRLLTGAAVCGRSTDQGDGGHGEGGGGELHGCWLVICRLLLLVSGSLLCSNL